uniref:Uncharacterized protein n=1 Tax=Rhizophora mucronata TaxID=61149 RepID=A0A2P2IKA3_RHIMU
MVLERQAISNAKAQLHLKIYAHQCKPAISRKHQLNHSKQNEDNNLNSNATDDYKP